MKHMLIACFFIWCGVVLAGNGNETTGAEAIGKAGAGITQTNVWSATNNIGALGFVNKYEVGLAYENRFSLANVGLKTLVATLPVGGGTFGLATHQFGFSTYQENRLGLAYGRKLSDHLSLGVQLNYLGVRIGDIYGSTSTVTAAVGMLIQARKNIRFGVLVYNPNQSKLAEFDDERIPSTLSLSGQYDFSEKASGVIQVDKSINTPINIITAFQYIPAESIFVRAGYATAQGNMSFGFGYLWKKLHVDVAAKWHQTIGFSTTASLNYELGNRKQKQ